MYSNVVCKRRGVSGTGFGLSFARFGSAILLEGDDLQMSHDWDNAPAAGKSA
jgi:hypothetical protein